MEREHKVKRKQQQTAFARKLRREQTEAERILWARLKGRQLEGIKFRRQQSIGGYVVDFVSFERKLIVEIDGGHHDEEEIRKKDNERTSVLRGENYLVLRFWNNDVLVNTDGVLEKICQALKEG